MTHGDKKLDKNCDGLFTYIWGYGLSNMYGHSSYSGIHPVLWDSPLLCSEVVEDKSPKTDVVETYMKIIWVLKIMVKNQTV